MFFPRYHLMIYYQYGLCERQYKTLSRLKSHEKKCKISPEIKTEIPAEIVFKNKYRNYIKTPEYSWENTRK